MSPMLAYWSIRGLGEPIRLLLGYIGEEFEDKQYDEGTAPEYKGLEEWFKIKHTLGFDFPNLPYLIDGDIKVSQSNAILAYLGRKHGLSGKTEKEKILVDVIANDSMDIKQKFSKLCYDTPENFEKLKDTYLAELRDKLKEYETLLESRQFCAGGEVTYADFIVYEMLDQQLQLEPALLKEFPNLRAFHQRIQDLATLKAYINSDKHKKLPVNSSMAAFGGTL